MRRTEGNKYMRGGGAKCGRKGAFHPVGVEPTQTTHPEEGHVVVSFMPRTIEGHVSLILVVVCELLQLLQVPVHFLCVACAGKGS